MRNFFFFLNKKKKKKINQFIFVSNFICLFIHLQLFKKNEGR